MGAVDISRRVRDEVDRTPAFYPGLMRILGVLGFHYGDETTTIVRASLVTHQRRWIRESEAEAFLRAVSGNAIDHGDEPIEAAMRRRIKKLVDDGLAKRPQVYPTAVSISIMLEEEYGKGISNVTVSAYVDIGEAQKRWVRRCRPEDLLSSIKTVRILGTDDVEVEKAVRRRFRGIVSNLLRAHPEVFPTGPNVAALIKTVYNIDFNEDTIQRTVDMQRLQKNWVRRCRAEVFLRAVKEGRFSRVDASVKLVMMGRFTGVVRSVLKQHPDTFPTCTGTIELLRKKHSLELSPSTITRNVPLAGLQSRWLGTSTNGAFLREFTARTFSKVEDVAVRDKAQVRFKQVVLGAIRSHPREYPTGPGIVANLKRRYGYEPTEHTCTEAIDLPKLQIRWIVRSTDWQILDAIAKGRFSPRTDPSVLEAQEARAKEALANQAANWRDISRQTLDRFEGRYPELRTFRHVVAEHVVSIDQMIAARVRPMRASRDEALHSLIGKRLEQSHAFRVLYALVKAGVCQPADVVSMLHESLPTKMAQVIPEISLTHQFVDSIFDGTFTTRPDRQLVLLGFAHWLTVTESAEILSRLNRAIGSGQSILVTSPIGYRYADGVADLFGQFGFSLVHTGHVSLTPEKGVVCRKLGAEAAIVELRKVDEPTPVPESVKLFSPDTRAGTGEARAPGKNREVSYDLDILRTAVPVVAMMEPKAREVDKPVELRSIAFGKDADGDMMLLELSSGVIVGFNMNPVRACTVEIRGKEVPSGLRHALAHAMRGEERGIVVSTSMRADYRRFVEMISGNAAKVTQKQLRLPREFR